MTKKKTQQQIKQQQAQMQSDAIEMSNFSEGVVYAGTGDLGTVDAGVDFTYDMGQLDLFDEMDMRDKYPALKQAYEHYQSILEACKTKEKEDNED